MRFFMDSKEQQQVTNCPLLLLFFSGSKKVFVWTREKRSQRGKGPFEEISEKDMVIKQQQYVTHIDGEERV